MLITTCRILPAHILHKLSVATEAGTGAVVGSTVFNEETPTLAFNIRAFVAGVA